MKPIYFLLPGWAKSPIGGYKVVFEYANRLAEDGYDVGIIYPIYCGWKGLPPLRILHLRIISLLRHIYYKLTKTYRQKWFLLDDSIREYLVWSLTESNIPNKDGKYIATGVETAAYLNEYRQIPNSNKYYLIQHFENWNASDKEVIDTYHYPFHKIVIAHWLEEIVRNAGEVCTVVPNGFDFNYFNIQIPFEKRDRFTVSMLYHKSEWKGCQDGFKALNIIKKQYPELKVNIFGAPPRPEELPDWYQYYQCPDRETHNRLYNESAVFIGTSWSEGWGLTVGEAMMCGCAVACTDNLGYQEMVTDKETALISPVKDPESLAVNIIKLIENSELRYRIATAGNKHIQSFTWNRSYSILKDVLFQEKKQ